MTTDIARFEANERVDLSDFSFLADESLRSQSRHWADQFFRDPTRDGPAWVLDGFAVAIAGPQLTVTLGRAILGHREDGEVFYGSLTTEGPAEQVVDVTTFANGTYGVYVRFELVDGESGSRAFWDPQGDGAEFAQTIATRRTASWSVRVELTSPGSEWLWISEVVVVAGSLTLETPKRDFFFEGKEHDSYLSQWSTDGGGDPNDRSANRFVSGVASLHTFVCAMRQCLEDIKGRGLRRWWERDIGGMNIGFDDAPVEDRLAVGDGNFSFHWDGTDPFVYFDSGSDYFWYDRSLNRLIMEIDGTECWGADETGLRARGIAVRDNLGNTPISDQISCGTSNFRMQWDSATSDAYFRFEHARTYFHWDDSEDYLNLTVATGNAWRAVINGTLTRGLVIDNSMALTMETDAIKVGDDSFKLDWDGTDPRIYFDGFGVSDDFLWYDRSTNRLIMRIDDNDKFYVETTGVVTNGLVVDSAFALTPVLNQVTIGVGDFALKWDGFDPFLYWDNGDYFWFDRSANQLILELVGDPEYYWGVGQAWIFGTTGDPTSGLAAAGSYTYAQNTGMWVMHGPINSGGADATEVKALHAFLNHTAVAERDLVGAASYTCYSVTFNLGQVANKVLRCIFWGTVKVHTSSGAFTWEMRADDGGTPVVLGASSFTPTAASGSSHNAMDDWYAECLIYVPLLTGTDILTSFYSGRSQIGAGTAVVDAYSYELPSGSAFDLVTNRLTITMVVSNTAGVTHTFDCCRAFIEEMGGQSN